MRLVANLNEALANADVLEAVRRDPNSSLRAAYQLLIKRGTCFLPYVISNGLAFAPSRFIGYAQNNLDRHQANEHRNGSETNAALNHILQCKPVENAALDQLYREFCELIDITPSRAGAFGVPRKFWIVPQIADRLDQIAKAEVTSNPTISETEKEQLAKARIGQGAFRDNLIAKWKRCCMSGCEITSILRASHIKPWHVSNNQERLDVYNGLLLSPNMDALFDKGYVSFENDGTLLISHNIKREDLIMLGWKLDLNVKFEAQHAKYLQYHRSAIFIDPVRSPEKRRRKAAR